MSEILTPQESVRLCELERVIQKGKDTFVEVGNALAEIRDSRIYRAAFKTFEDYCQKRWEFEKAYAFRMSAKPTATLKNARKTGEILGLSPSQMSELLKAKAITPDIHEGSLIRYDVEKVRKQLAKRARDRAEMNHPGDMVPTI